MPALRALLIIGIAMPAISTMMPTTTSTSTSVKPPWRVVPGRCVVVRVVLIVVCFSTVRDAEPLRGNARARRPCHGSRRDVAEVRDVIGRAVHAVGAGADQDVGVLLARRAGRVGAGPVGRTDRRVLEVRERAVGILETGGALLQ